MLVERAEYRTRRLLDRADKHADPMAFVRMMSSRNKTDLARALELIAARSGDL